MEEIKRECYGQEGGVYWRSTIGSIDMGKREGRAGWGSTLVEGGGRGNCSLGCQEQGGGQVQVRTHAQNEMTFLGTYFPPILHYSFCLMLLLLFLFYLSSNLFHLQVKPKEIVIIIFMLLLWLFSIYRWLPIGRDEMYYSCCKLYNSTFHILSYSYPWKWFDLICQSLIWAWYKIIRINLTHACLLTVFLFFQILQDMEKSSQLFRRDFYPKTPR